MLVRYFGAAALALQCARAFKDASPFFMFSSSELDTQELRTAQVASASSILSNAQTILNDCTKHGFVVVHQPGVSPADFAAHEYTPLLEKRLSLADQKTKTAVTIPNVVGHLRDEERLYTAAQDQQCGANTEWKYMELDNVKLDAGIPNLRREKLQTIKVKFDAPPADREERMATLSRHDHYLNEILEQLDSYTVVYITSPIRAKIQKQIEQEDRTVVPPYEMDSPFPSGMHGDLKRDLSVRAKASNSSRGNLDSNLPLFEKYQFVNQGIFITGSVTILLLVILSVGVSAIANLEVSYMAFSKEMGPAAQKKQQ